MTTFSILMLFTPYFQFFWKKLSLLIIIPPFFSISVDLQIMLIIAW
jgi:hypothetical protein